MKETDTTNIQSDQLCKYGCGNLAMYEFKSGKKCCSSHYNKCPAVIERKIKKQSKIGRDGLNSFQRGAIKTREKMAKRNSSGLNQYQINSRKGVSIRRADVDENGLNANQRRAKNLHQKLKETVNPETGKTKLEEKINRQKRSAKKVGTDGLTSHQRGAIKTVKVRKNDIKNGKNSYERAFEKVIDEMKADVDINGVNRLQRIRRKTAEKIKKNLDENGLNQYQRIAALEAERRKTDIIDNLNAFERAAVKGRETALSNVDKNGHDSYDRAFIAAVRMQQYPGLDIYFQGTYERAFIDQLVEEHGFEWTKANLSRGPNFKYKCPASGKIRTYKSDYRIGQVIYEIKSGFTFCLNTKGDLDQIKLATNLAKLAAAVDAGYQVQLVLDKQNNFSFDEVTTEDILASIPLVD